jgi:hypothetical protein
MRRPFGIVLALGSFLASASAQAQPTVDDLLAPIQGGPREVKEPQKVRVEGNVVSAASAQDAVNAAVQANVKEAGASTTPEIGARWAKFPSGLGVVATGLATYRTMENPTATRLAQRKAYVIAFMRAKTEMAKFLKGVSNDGGEQVRDILAQVALPKEDLANSDINSKEAITQKVERLLRGFVIYEVNDDPKQQLIHVSIVSTPRTQGRLNRPVPSALEADDLRDGLNQVLQEVRTGLVPPVGGRVILVKKTGETAFVGFGSAIVASNKNAALQARLNLDALKVASIRSVDSLCGLIIGDRTSWQGQVSETQKDVIRDFEELKADDPLAKNNPAGVQKLEKARQEFVNKRRTDELLTSARKGILPPGISPRCWYDEDHAWAYAISVYIPSQSRAAAEFGKQMDESVIVTPEGRPVVSGFTDENNPNIPRPNPKVKAGPSGKVGNEKEM